MFNPSQADVRRFFCGVWGKHRDGLPLTPLETLALDWIGEHPEYHDDLVDVDAALERQYPPEGGRTNPFLHLSMHLAIAEQLSIDQPPGIRAAHDVLARRRGSAHEAAHEVMESLGETLWEAQRHGTPPDAQKYLARLKMRAGTP